MYINVFRSHRSSDQQVRLLLTFPYLKMIRTGIFICDIVITVNFGLAGQLQFVYTLTILLHVLVNTTNSSVLQLLYTLYCNYNIMDIYVYTDTVYINILQYMYVQTMKNHFINTLIIFNSTFHDVIRHVMSK